MAEGQVESAAEVETDPPAVVRRWLKEIELADRTEREWMARAKKVVERYRDENRATTNTGSGPIVGSAGSAFNILWSNTETLKPALGDGTPPADPDIRRRWKDDKPVGREAAQVLERAVSYSNDMDGFGVVMDQVREDYLLPGRAVLRVDFVPGEFTEPSEAEGENVEPFPVRRTAPEMVEAEYVLWDRFKMSPARSWEDVRWVCYEHRMTRREMEDSIPDVKADAVAGISLDSHVEGITQDERDLSFFKRATVFEIWDKDAREVVWIGKGWAAGPLSVRPDPLKLKDFFNCPRPLYAVETNGTMVPIPEFTMYQDQANELNKVTTRIDRIVAAMRVVGAAPADMPNIRQMATGTENDVILIENWLQFAERGGIQNLIQWLPIENFARALVVLYQQRDQLLETIFEITGISDIMRGATDPRETKGAQELKGRFGAFRLRPRQMDIARFVRDTYRLKAEIVARHFNDDVLREMTGIELPSADDKLQIQNTIQQAQAAVEAGQLDPSQIPPEMAQEAQATLQQPSWDEVMALLRSDAETGFNVDVESDATGAPDDQQDKAEVVAFLQALGTYLATVGPLVAQGFVPIGLAISVLKWAARKWKVSREIEDELDAATESLQAQGPQPDPVEMAKAENEKAKAENEAARTQVEGQEVQVKGQEVQLKAREQQLEEAKFNRGDDAEQGERGGGGGQGGVVLNLGGPEVNEMVGAASSAQLEASRQLVEAGRELAQAGQAMAAAASSDTVVVRDDRGEIVGTRKVQG